ncbi:MULTISPECIES: AAA family ATPase [Bizionia]|uniref:ATP-binding protein n=1 Tax=Bizionia algoritergicola TaxID=291187 RepID=A0A5D0QWM0_9FLAO|nr:MULTISPECIES: ATP-binding protein [Bizionia]OBX22225.1 ATPase [Bizionia sp. APA-3]TYB73259.1 ATP-binding protein [Bizionia algoritergicola]
MKIKKIVITGGPGTGKTSIINELKTRGYVCLDEISRQITLKAREDGVDQLFLTQPLLFSELLLKGREDQFNQANTQSESFVFLDRGIPDVLAYMDFIGDDYPEKFRESCKKHNYDLAFILKPWQDIFVSDSERYENFNQAIEIHDNLLKTYDKFGYNLLDVPFDTVENRTAFILNVVKNL